MEKIHSTFLARLGFWQSFVMFFVTLLYGCTKYLVTSKGTLALSILTVKCFSGMGKIGPSWVQLIKKSLGKNNFMFVVPIQ